MNSFLGLVALDSIHNNKTYSTVIREILHYLHCHQSELKLIQTSHLITVQSLHNTNSFTLPKHGQYIHTCHHKVSFSEAPTDSEMTYFKNILECLLILKEHFPSKIQIEIMAETEHLESRLDFELVQGVKDLSRRYISHFRTLLSKAEDVSQDNVNDILYILRKQDSQKLISLGLSILKKSPQNLLLNINQMEMRTLEQLSEVEEHEKNVGLIFQKITQGRKSKVQQLQESRKSVLSSRTKYDEPTILNSFIFQLKESNNIERLGFLVEKVSTQVFKLDKDSLERIDKAVASAIERSLDGNKIENTHETLVFVDSVLRYLMLRKYVSNWEVVIDLLVESLRCPVVFQGIETTFMVFFGEFKERADQVITGELLVLMQRFTKMGKLQTAKQTRKQGRAEQSCRTSRNTMLKGRKPSKSTYAK